MVRVTPETLTLVRHRAQPTAAFIARLSLAAVFAYLLALLLPGSSRPVLAPLTALLIVQVTMFQTVRSALQRVVSVVAGVLVAVTLSAVVGFTWWSLAILIAAGLAVGHLLHLGDHIIEVPISAMLILSLDTRAAATERITETLVGACAGMIGGFIFAPLRVQPAEEAVDDLSRQLAGLLDQMASDLEQESTVSTAGDRLAQARALSREIHRVDGALAQAEESLRLNPRRRLLPRAGIALRDGLERLDRAVVTVRGIARSLADGSQLDTASLHDAETRRCLAAAFRELGAAVRAFGRFVGMDVSARGGPARREEIEAELRHRLSKARALQHRLAELLRAEPATGLASWAPARRTARPSRPLARRVASGAAHASTGTLAIPRHYPAAPAPHPRAALAPTAQMRARTSCERIVRVSRPGTGRQFGGGLWSGRE
jgi:hypothetical protein